MIGPVYIGAFALNVLNLNLRQLDFPLTQRYRTGV